MFFTLYVKIVQNSVTGNITKKEFGDSQVVGKSNKRTILKRHFNRKSTA